VLGAVRRNQTSKIQKFQRGAGPARMMGWGGGRWIYDISDAGKKTGGRKSAKRKGTEGALSISFLIQSQEEKELGSSADKWKIHHPPKRPSGRRRRLR